MTAKRTHWKPFFAETVSQLLAKHTFGDHLPQSFFVSKVVEGVTGVNVASLLWGKEACVDPTEKYVEDIASTIGMVRVSCPSKLSRGDVLVFTHHGAKHAGVSLGMGGVTVVSGGVLHFHTAEIDYGYTYAEHVAVSR